MTIFHYFPDLILQTPTLFIAAFGNEGMVW